MPSLASPIVSHLRVEYAANPIGIDNRTPRFSWWIEARVRGTTQSAYQIRVARSQAALETGTGILWDSTRIDCNESILRPYGGPPPTSRQRYYWQARVWDQNGLTAEWSKISWWEMGLLDDTDWSAIWIEPRETDGRLPLLRREFFLSKPVSRARAYATSRGLYQLRLNGQRVGDDELTPGFTSYRKRLQYQTYDVTHLVRAGGNAIGALLGEGWYAGVVGIGAEWNNRPHRYGDRLALLLQLEVTYEDGTVEQVVSDADWKSTAGPIVMSGIYAGETYDARLEQPGWDEPGFADSSWSLVRPADVQTAVLVAQAAPPARRMQTLVPVDVRASPKGEAIVDMGQNMVGWVRLSVQGSAGATVVLRHGEAVDAEGNLYSANLGKARQTVTYTLKGTGVETFEPHFTYHGFRYVAIDGFPGRLTADDVTGVVVHSGFERACHFETSHPLLNQLHHNIEWSQKGNFVDIPSDCPQRDERLGWTGDAQIFAATATFNANVASFFNKWLGDLKLDQREDGSVPWVIPDVLGVLQGSPLATLNGKPAAGAAGWGDAATVIPWTLYQAYNDPQFLQDHYESMCRWVEYQRQRAGRDLIWRGDFQFGDWAAVAGAGTNSDLIATAYFAHSVHLISCAARVLGSERDAVAYAGLLHAIRAAFNREFVHPDGTVGDDTQSAYVLALQFDLLSCTLRPLAARRLAENVRKTNHLTTGFLGTPWLLFALSENGYLDEAYRLLLRRDSPSWLFPVTKGATTMWEQWNGIQPDGTFYADPLNNSFNHYAYGAVGDWMHRVIGGINIDPECPGYKRIIFAPKPGGGLTSANVAHVSQYGRVSCEWALGEGVVQVAIEVPVNTSGRVRLEGARTDHLLEDGQPIAGRLGIASVHQEDSALIVHVGSGRFVFEYPASDCS